MAYLLLCLLLFVSSGVDASEVRMPASLYAETHLEASTKPAEYAGSALYDYIDGDADRFMKYGFKTCLSRSYRSAGLETEISLFEMGDSLAAVQVFQESCGERQPMESGRERYCWGEQIFFCCKGAYYIEISDKGTEKLKHGQSLSLMHSVLSLLP